MRTLSLLLVLLAGPALAGQTVWKWVDGNGVTHYSDRPVPGATRMEISTGSSVGPTYSPDAYDSSTSPQDAPAAPAGYRSFEIWRPSQEETIPNTGGTATVNLRLEPSLQAGHSISLYLDGKIVEGFASNASA